MVFTIPPPDFNPAFETVSCFVLHNQEILLLLRQVHKSQGNKWGVPAGKREAGESLVESIQREVAEETGILVPILAFQFLQTVYIRYPDIDFTYHIFETTLAEKVPVTISPQEHLDSTWVSLGAHKQLTLVDDSVECMRLFYQI